MNMDLGFALRLIEFLCYFAIIRWVACAWASDTYTVMYVVLWLYGLLQETYDSVRLDLAAAAHHNYHYGVKIVRGAYIALERALAKEQCA